jgi:hypothetical protein
MENFENTLHARMAKELDLFESNHGCGLNAPIPGKTSETDVTHVTPSRIGA